MYTHDKRNTNEFLSHLKELDIKLWVDGEQLRCDAPKAALTPSVLSELQARKTEIIEFLCKANLTRNSTFEAIRPIPRDGDLPLSFGQQRLWFIDKLEGESATYNEFFALKIDGNLDIALLEQSFTEIFRRHEVLRTNFIINNESPVQVISPALTINVPVVDLQTLAETEQCALVEKIIGEEQRRAFNLSHDPLLRVKLLQLGQSLYVLLVTMHHIVCDGWSMEIFIREFTALYEAFSQGKVSPLPPLSLHYVDYAHWQRQLLNSSALTNQLNYWQKQLAGAPPLLEIPTDSPRPPKQTFAGANLRFEFNAQLTEKLKLLSQKFGVTLYMTLLSAYVILLSRYSGQDDIVVGSPIAGRNRSETESLIGFFVNTLVLRIKLERCENFSELLQRVRSCTLDAYDRQDVPFDLLVEKLQPQRSLSYSPVFQVGFSFQNTSMEKLDLPGVTLTPLEIEKTTVRNDLILSIEETESGLIGYWQYNTVLFHTATIERLKEHFLTLLEEIVSNPQQSIGDLPLLTASEHHQLLAWNDTQLAYPNESCIHELFETQVEKTPDAIAVVFQDQQLTYRKLNYRANQVANYLLSLGVSKEVPVGICVERTPSMVIGLLGILKAGASYLPLNPNYPFERLAFFLEDVQPPIILTQEHLLDKLPSTWAKAICLDSDWEDIADSSKENPVTEVKAEDLAYIIYTSGSTGQPKGVLVPHKGLCNLAQAQIRSFDVRTDSRVLQFAAFSFDASVSEIFMTLCSGASLCLATADEMLPGDNLIQLIQHLGITHITLPPSALAVLPTAELPTLQSVIVAGEACSADLVARWSANRRFFNAYGPSEATVCATIAECNDPTKKPTIGRPIDNVQVYILDKNLQPVPIGVTGEIYIGGVGVARGYLNREDLTAQKFIKNPFSTNPDARLYKTGDLARYLRDGNIEFLGRVDHQVKIRGFRIEPDEIQAVLAQNSNVQDVVVIVRTDHLDRKRLVAYIVEKNKSTSNPVSTYRSYLKEILPDFMIPSEFLFVESLPLTPNGKVDREALLLQGLSQVEFSETYVAPRTPVEQTLADIWAEVLGVQRVGIHSNFFELGGDSILSIQIIAKANQADLVFTPKQLFEHQTIAELALVTSTSQKIEAEQGIVTGEVILTPIQRWFFERELTEAYHWNQSMLLKVPSTVNITLLEKAIQHLLQQHDALRLRFLSTAAGWQQSVVSPEEVTQIIRIIDLSSLPEVEKTAAMEAAADKLQASLNLESGSLVQVALFKLSPQLGCRLLIIVHHLAVDGVSWRILLSDLQNVYQQLSNQDEVKLPPKTTSFKQWAKTLNEYAQSTALEKDQDYWLSLCKHDATPLPVDYLVTKDANTVESAKLVSAKLSVSETRALLSEVPQAYNTQINDVLLTALLMSLTQWVGKRQLLIDLEGHGREEIFNGIDLSRTVGWFTSLFPVQLSLPEIDTLQSVIKSVKEQLRCIPNRGIGYGILRYLKEDTAITKELQNQAQPEVSFNYLGQFDQVLSSDTAFEPAYESKGRLYSPKGSRGHLIEIDAFVAGGCLQLDWSYSENIHQKTTIENLAQSFIEALKTLIAHCLSTEAGGYTPSDFPEIDFNQEELDEILAEIDSNRTED